MPPFWNVLCFGSLHLCLLSYHMFSPGAILKSALLDQLMSTRAPSWIQLLVWISPHTRRPKKVLEKMLYVLFPYYFVYSHTTCSPGAILNGALLDQLMSTRAPSWIQLVVWISPHTRRPKKDCYFVMLYVLVPAYSHTTCSPGAILKSALMDQLMSTRSPTWIQLLVWISPHTRRP